MIAADFTNEVKGKLSVKGNEATLQFAAPTKLNRLVLGEDITQGQRVSGFEVLYQRMDSGKSSLQKPLSAINVCCASQQWKQQPYS